MTDMRFWTALYRVSGGGKVHFTARSLWYALDRRVRRTGLRRRSVFECAMWGGLPGFVVAQFIGIAGLALMGAGALGGVGYATYRNLRSRYTLSRGNRPHPYLPGPRWVLPEMPFEVFLEQYLLRWIRVHGKPPTLLPPRDTAAVALPREVPPDVAAFSFDRAVVTDRWETAAMLVANRFHFEHNCAVLSVDGYPDGIADTVKEMLRRNPRLTVFALHDASLDGCHLPLVLRQPEWFPDPAVRVVDLGLRPETAMQLCDAVLRGPAVYRPFRLEKMLSEKELVWLTHGFIGELAAMSPTHVMRAAYRGIVAAERGEAAAAAPSPAGLYFGGVIWVGDPGGATDTAAVDGFG